GESDRLGEHRIEEEEFDDANGLDAEGIEARVRLRRTARAQDREPADHVGVGRLGFFAWREEVRLATEEAHDAVGALEVGAEREEVPRLVVGERGSGESLEMLEPLANESLEREAVALCAPLRARQG